jgi:hypothetical protein
MRVLAVRAEGEYLVETRRGKGRLFNDRIGLRWPIELLGPLLARGYWEPWEGSRDDERAIIRRMEGVPTVED